MLAVSHLLTSPNPNARTFQEAGLSQSEDNVRSYELLHRGVEDRFRALQQQRQAEEAAAAAAKVVQVGARAFTAK